MKNELDNFTSTLISDPYYYYASDFFFDSTTIIKEIKCLDLTYLMEQRLRYTHIRDELELPHLASKLRRKCGKCLKYSAGEHSDSGKEELEKPKEENQDPEKDMDNKDVTQTEAQQELGITTETIESEKTDQGELSSASEASDSEETDQRKLDSISEIADSEKTDQGKPGSASETVDSEKVYQATSTGQEKKKKRKPRKKKGKSRNLEVLNRFWFKRDPSPPPEDEMEEHLDELRMRTRKEIHTLLFLSSAVVSIRFILRH